jgi:hypothetical protein
MDRACGGVPGGEGSLGRTNEVDVNSGPKKLVIEGDRMACLLMLGGCLPLFLQFVEEVTKAARLRMREMVLLAVVQVKA